MRRRLLKTMNEYYTYTDPLWCEDCKYFTRYDMGGEGFCDVDDSSTWYGRPICKKFERKE